MGQWSKRFSDALSSWLQELRARVARIHAGQALGKAAGLKAVNQDVSLTAVFGEVACCSSHNKHRSNALVCQASNYNKQLCDAVSCPSLLCKE